MLRIPKEHEDEKLFSVGLVAFIKFTNIKLT